jgi:CAAX prenyl protease-like protein
VTTNGEARDAGHGWWPYVLPYAGFLAAVETFNRIVPDAWSGLGLVLKPAVPAALLIYYASRGAYPELRRFRLDPSGRVLDVALGLLLAALWILPFVWIDAIRPDVEGFDSEQLGAAGVGLALALRMAGYAIITPLFEEIFIRSFVMRYSEVYRSRGDFRKVPLAVYTPISFVVTVVVFTLGHVPWEWWVAVPWVAITNLWFYYRKDLYAVILVHATTNAAILVAAVLWTGRFVDGEGNPISLWFFV